MLSPIVPIVVVTVDAGSGLISGGVASGALVRAGLSSADGSVC